MMKRFMRIVLAIIFMLSIHTTYTGSSTPDPTPVPEIDADAYWIDHYWQLEASIRQIEEFGIEAAGIPGMYMDYNFKIKMTGGDPIKNKSITEGLYIIQVESTLIIDTNEAADWLLSKGLGTSIGGMEFGVNAELSGSYQGGMPYYIDDNSCVAYPEYDENFEPIWPEGKQNASLGNMATITKIDSNWQSPIKSTDGSPVNPAVGKYLVFDTFVMNYTGASSQLLYGAFDENVAYDIYLYIVIEPEEPGVIDLGDFAAKVYLNVIHNGIETWLEGEGMLKLIQELTEK